MALSLWGVAQAISPSTLTVIDDPLLIATGNCPSGDEWIGGLPCEQYTFKGNRYGVMWLDNEIYRIDLIHENGELQNLYLSPKRTWI